MTYNEALAYIHSNLWQKNRPGLSRVKTLLSALGNPERALRVVHVTGTNGKGSTSAMLESILRAAGYRTGLFISPYIRVFNERIQLCGRPISNDRLAAITERVAAVADRMDEKPTEFELITAIGLSFFAEERVDVAVVEVGLGGRLDPTNVFDAPLLSIITGVALDHTAILGETCREIAYEKAGIIKPSSPILFGDNGRSSEAEAVIRSTAASLGAPYYKTDESTLSVSSYSLRETRFSYAGREYALPLLGSYQPQNAATVLTAVDVLRGAGLSLPDAAVREGLRTVRFPARFECFSENPPVVYDGGHNPQGIAAAKACLAHYFGDRRVLLLSGVMQDKHYAAMVDSLSDVAEAVYTVTPNNPRALPAEALAALYRERGIEATPYDSVPLAVSEALERAKETNTPLLVLGSLYLYVEVEGVLRTLLQNEETK